MCINWKLFFFHAIWEIRLQRTLKISQMVTNLRKPLLINIINPVLRKSHVLCFRNSFSFRQKTCFKMTSRKLLCISSAQVIAGSSRLEFNNGCCFSCEKIANLELKWISSFSEMSFENDDGLEQLNQYAILKLSLLNPNLFKWSKDGFLSSMSLCSIQVEVGWFSHKLEGPRDLLLVGRLVGIAGIHSKRWLFLMLCGYESRYQSKHLCHCAPVRSTSFPIWALLLMPSSAHHTCLNTLFLVRSWKPIPSALLCTSAPSDDLWL